MRKLALLLASCLVVLAPEAVADVASHCTAAERIIWSCKARAKIYSLCASTDLDRTRGYLQYRAGKLKAVELRFPPLGRHPSEAFHFGLLPHGASLKFRNGNYDYEISEDLKGEPVIFVSGPDRSSSMQCEASTNSLTLNATIELFASAGVKERPRE